MAIGSANEPALTDMQAIIKACCPSLVYDRIDWVCKRDLHEGEY